MARKTPRSPGDPYRDASHGAEARRGQLLDERRLQVAMQPLQLRSLYVRRYARAVTGLGVFAAGCVISIAGMDPAVYRWLADMLPGAHPAPLATLFTAILAGGLTLYFIARSIGERRFTVVMQRSITASHDVYSDVDRLSAQHPDAVAASMAARVGMWSRALPMMAMLAVMPLIYLWGVEALFGSWPTPAWIDHRFREVAPSVLPPVVWFSVITLWLCRGFRPGQEPSRLWKPAAIIAACVVPVLSLTVCACHEAASPIGLAGMTVVFALATVWAHRPEAEEPVHRIGTL